MLLALQGGKLLHNSGLRSNTYFDAGQILKKGFRGLGRGVGGGWGWVGGGGGGGGGGGRSVGERRAQ